MALRIHLVFVFLLSLYSVNGFFPAERFKMMPADLGFSWGNCGPSTNPIQIKTLNSSPHPIKIPGNATINFVVDILSTLPTEIHVSFNLEKKVDNVYIKVPCEHNMGSCNYSDFCGKWGDICHKGLEKYGFPCQCPIPAGSYSVSNAIVDFSEKLPSQADGEFKLNINIGSSSGQIGCLDLQFKFKN